MFKGLIGKKIGMTQIFDEAGASVPVTLIEAGPCFVTQVRTVEKERYSAVQLGFSETKPKRLTGGQLGHLKRNDMPPLRYLREFRTKANDLQEGDRLTVAVFSVGEHVDIVGTSKGKGFAGVVKRYGFAGGPKTHGQSDRWRAPGSIGQSSYPSRVFKGTRMAGRMGKDKVTVLNLPVVKIIEAENLMLIKGSVPGFNGALLKIRKSNRSRNGM